MEEKRVSIKDIAAMSGVSVSAVSRYLNDGYISDEKKEAIAAAIEKTGYIPSKHAQTLRTKKTNIIGVIVPRISSEAVARIVDGISEELSKTPYQMLFASTSNNYKKEIEYLKLFDNNPVDGIILCGTVYTKALKSTFKKLSVPVVVVGQHFPDVSCVYHNDYGAAMALTNKLIDSGCNKIACIGVTQEDVAAGRERYRGYCDALREKGIKIDSELYKETDFSIDGGYQRAGELLSEHKNVDGIFCATDNIAIGVMKRYFEKGYRIPDDIQVVGIGHNRMSRVATPKLTTAHLFYRDSGAESVKMLLKMINSRNYEGINQIKLEYKVMDGNSTKL